MDVIHLHWCRARGRQGVLHRSSSRWPFLCCHQHHPQDAQPDCWQALNPTEIVSNPARLRFPHRADPFYEISAISLDALGGISRLDYFIFTYTFTSTELSRKRANLIVYCVVVRDIDANTLRVIISRAFRGGDTPHSTLTAIYSQLITAINAPVTQFLTTQEKEELEACHNQKKIQQEGLQPNGGLITYGDGAPPTNKEIVQSGFNPVEATAWLQVEQSPLSLCPICTRVQSNDDVLFRLRSIYSSG